jgi:hypothetical protein
MYAVRVSSSRERKMKYVSPYFSKGQKIRSYRSNSYTPEGTPLEMEIDTYI